MRVTFNEVNAANRDAVALAAFDTMQPYALSWFEAMCGMKTLGAFCAWFRERVSLVVSIEGCVLFFEEPSGEAVVVHPFISPRLRGKVAALRTLLVRLGERFGRKTLIVRVTHRASQRIRELVEACGFRRRGTARVGAEGYVYEEWLKMLERR